MGRREAYCCKYIIRVTSPIARVLAGVIDACAKPVVAAAAWVPVVCFATAAAAVVAVAVMLGIDPSIGSLKMLRDKA